MQYRKFSDKISFKPSALGFGLMRLPVNQDNSVNEDEAVKMVRFAIDNGVNYLDTAYVYHGGQSERILAKVLKDGYRSKVKIADKMPLWSVKEESDLDRIFYEQLEKLEVEKIDFYLLHSLSEHSLPLFEKFNLIQWLENKKKQGLIDYFGFSFHDKLEVLKKIIDIHSWDFMMIQLNLIDIKQQVGLEGVKYAHKKGLGVIIMEPLRGGQLTQSIPDDINYLWSKMAKIDSGDVSQTNFQSTKFLLDFVWNIPEVSFLISGMSNMTQVEENLSFADNSKINNISKEKLSLYLEIQEKYLSKILINCTDCKYCNICPKKIAIPNIFNLLNEISRFENESKPKFGYNFIPEDSRAKNCIQCGECIAICPQKLDIPNILQKATEIFDLNKSFYDYYK
jgi:predicted aldo/keto reductase-like oxidoreductase